MIVACVEWGDYQGRGAEYVQKLRAMVRRHLRQAHEFVCLTDDPRRHPGLRWDQYHDLPCIVTRGLTGWWAKLYLFSAYRFPVGERILYLDLDSFIVGPLDELVRRKGIIHLGRWGWKKNDYGSGCMVWDAGEHAEIFDRFDRAVPHRLRGDQDWMTELGGWDALPFPLVCSAKYHCKDGPPAGASVVCCHGPKKPHLFEESWAREAWASATS